MRKKLLVILLLLVVLIVLVVTRCGGKKDQQNDPADGQGFAQQSGKAELPAELKLGVVTETESGAMQLEVEQNGEKTVYVFSDITINDWYVPVVNYVVTNGLMSGTDVGGGLSLFRPNYGMTRAQLAMILYRFAGGEPVAAPRHTYGDVSSGEWYYDCVNWADTNGYIKPESTDSFGVEAYCSCEEVLAVLHRLAGSPESNASLEDYPYAPKVSETNLSAVRWAWEKGLIAEDECVWYPTQAVSRAQIALLLMRYDQILGVHDLMIHDYGPGHQFASLHVEFPAESDPLTAHDVIDNIERDFLKKDNLQVTIHYDPIVTSDAKVGVLRTRLTEHLRQLDPQLSIHDLRIVPGDTHTNVLFDLAFPAGYTGDTDAVMAEMCRFVTGQDPNYSCIIKLEQSYAAVPQSPK